MKNVIIIPADGSDCRVHTLTEDEDEMRFVRKIVGGYFEVIATHDPTITLWANEDGLRLNLPVNKRALGFAHAGTLVVGDVILMGAAYENGDTKAVPEFYEYALGAKA